MRKKTNEQFIEESIVKYGNKYDYSLVNYNTSQDKVKIICPKHGIFEIRANHHLRGRGCKFCTFEKYSKDYTFTTEQFVEKAKLKHGDKFNYSLVNYKGVGSKVEILCSKHGSFWILAGKHLENQGCVECSYNRTVLTGEEVVPEGAKAIPLTQGKYAIVDEEDYDRVMQYKWCFTTIGYADTSNKRNNLKMHRVILNVIDPNILIDHANHNKLDNRKRNLRECTKGQNQYNKKPTIGKSKYKGVILFSKNKWRARISFENKRVSLGLFDNEEDAARAYDTKAKDLHKEFAYLNFPND